MAAAATKQFRRKQDAILGLDNPHSDSSSVRTGCQSGLSRQDTLKSIAGRSIRTVGSIPAEISHFPQIPEHGVMGPDSDGENEVADAHFMDIRRETESALHNGEYRGSVAASSAEDRLGAYSEEEEEEDEEYDSLEDDISMYAGSLARRGTVQSKRIRELQDSRNSMRSTSALGFRSGSHDSAMALPSKAERMLGIATKQQPRSTSAALATGARSNKKSKGGLPSKAQRLLGVKAEVLAKTRRLHPAGTATDASDSTATNKASADYADDFRRMLLNRDKDSSWRRRATESTSDTSSLSRSSVPDTHSRSSLLESHTSRSSHELFSPDGDLPTWTSPNSVAPPWIGVHPAYRNKASVDADALSPKSLHYDEYSRKFAASANLRPATENLEPPVGYVELDAGPIGPPSPVELPVPETPAMMRSHSSGPGSVSVSKNPQTRSASKGPSSLAISGAFSGRPASADAASPTSAGQERKQSRPSAIFDNPNIFEMPGDMPASPVEMPTSRERSCKGGRKMASPSAIPPTPPSSGRSMLPLQQTPSHRRHHSSSSSPSLQSPYPAPMRPLPAPPANRRDSSTLQSIVNTEKTRQRQTSHDSPPSSTTVVSREPSRRPSQQSVEPQGSSEPAPLQISGMVVPSPLALAAAGGDPITSQPPPPLLSPSQYPLSPKILAAQAEKKRVELSDKSEPRPNKPLQRSKTEHMDSAHRPFSWQSAKTARSMTINEEVPPMPPPLALKIPSDAVRKASQQMVSGSRSAVAATPQTANSARSRASRLEKALEQALSKEGMDKALGGERIEDLFRSAGADELFHPCNGSQNQTVELEGDCGDEESAEEARQAAHRAQDLLKDLSELQREVDQLRLLYAEGGIPDVDVPERQCHTV